MWAEVETHGASARIGIIHHEAVPRPSRMRQGPTGPDQAGSNGDAARAFDSIGCMTIPSGTVPLSRSETMSDGAVLRSTFEMFAQRMRAATRYLVAKRMRYATHR